MTVQPSGPLYEIVAREDFSDVTYLLEVSHPRMARAAKPGQFVIVMSHPEGERIPLTIADFDRDRGTITLVIQAVGKTTREMQANLKVGESVTVANYTLTYTGLDAEQGPNYTEFLASMDLTRNGSVIGQILPRKTIYNKNQEQPMTEVGLRPGPVEDVYVVLAGFDNFGAADETASFKVYVNPLMSWMWLGGVVMILGVLLSSWPRRSPATVEAAHRVPGGTQPA